MGSMRKSTWIVFLPLFLFLFFDIDSLFCLHSGEPCVIWEVLMIMIGCHEKVCTCI
ncbi:hypothetical protein RchiOBHm_Chr6g0258091 [Rosa chinensis]|uniref:Uncharacterized protein n=1 Tax=Rosa chinensis TaxID=74649 RepID=A0A2P6PMH8_ROSCH|nr:hypothetical protein RchiOBHm_Chr6g0258091 [Rosa chinensis]